MILPRLKTDIVQIFFKCITNKLNKTILKWKKEKSMTIVLCAKAIQVCIKNLKLNLDKVKLSKNNYIYHAGTKLLNNELRTCGGRLLNVTSTGEVFWLLEIKLYLILKNKLERRFLPKRYWMEGHQ